MGYPIEKQKTFDPALAKWVIEVRSGNTEAYGLLIEATQNSLFRFFVYLCGDKLKAEDLCQETYIKAFEKLAKLEDPAKFSGWLFKLGRNHFLDTVRGEKKWVSLPEEEREADRIQPQTEADPTDADSVHRMLGQLSQEDRMVLILVDLEGHSYGEAAEIIGISESALRSRLHRVRQQAVKILKA